MTKLEFTKVDFVTLLLRQALLQPDARISFLILRCFFKWQV